MRRRRLTRDQKFIVSAVAAGLLLAAGHGQGGPGHAATAATAGSGSSNEQLANSMAASAYGWAGSETTCLDELWTEESGFIDAQLNIRRDRHPAAASQRARDPGELVRPACPDQVGPGLRP
jgi:hypothetical protein